MIAAGFSVFSACLLGCFVGLSASQDVYCLKNNSRLKASSSSKCHSQTYLCQAIRDGGLYLECVKCDQLQETNWTLPDKGLGAIPKITTPNNTLYLPGNVTPGCYYCQCGNNYASIEYLLFSVCPLNSGKRNKRTYNCCVSNGVSENITSRKDNVEVQATNWILHTHPLQTVGTIFLLGGVGNGTVAAYNDWWDDDSELSISYEICKIPDHLNLTAASMPSCLYKQLNCCSCDPDSSADNCPFNLTSHSNDEAVDPAGMYEPTVACYFQVREEMDIAMFATRCYYDGSSCEDRVRQLMGISEVRTVVSPSPPTTHFDTNVYIAAGVGSGGFLLGILVAVLCCVVVVIVVYRKVKNRNPYHRVPEGERVPGGEGVPRDLPVAGGGNGDVVVEGGPISSSSGRSTPIDRCIDFGDSLGGICVRVTREGGKLNVGIGHHTNDGFSEQDHFVSSGEGEYFRIQQKKSQTHSDM